MPDKILIILHKRWVQILSQGILGIVAGVLIAFYVRDSASTIGYLFFGLGLGFALCSYVVKSLEDKLKLP